MCECVEGGKETRTDYVVIQFTYTHKSCCERAARSKVIVDMLFGLGSNSTHSQSFAYTF